MQTRPTKTHPAEALQAVLSAHDVVPLLNETTHGHLLSDTTGKVANITASTVGLSAANVQDAVLPVRSLQGPYPVAQQDLLIAFPADEQHLPIVQAGRQWHQVCLTVAIFSHIAW